jgi:PhnB protein
MTMQTNIYLHFNGRCEEAFRFYETALGGTIEMFSTYDSAPAGMPISTGFAKKVLHARMRLGDTVIFGSDAPPDRFAPPQGFSISLTADSIGEAEKIFTAISAGGHAHMPLTETFFAKRFGMTVDKFGVPWMVLCDPSS